MSSLEQVEMALHQCNYDFFKLARAKNHLVSSYVLYILLYFCSGLLENVCLLTSTDVTQIPLIVFCCI